MNQQPEYTHVAIPKDLMSQLWAYLEQRPFKEVGAMMMSPGIQMVKLEAPKPQVVPASEEKAEQ